MQYRRSVFVTLIIIIVCAFSEDFGMCVGWAILSLFGIYIQFVYTSRNVSHRKTKDKAKKLEAQVKEQQRALQKQNELVVPLLAAQEPDAMEMRPVT